MSNNFSEENDLIVLEKLQFALENNKLSENDTIDCIKKIVNSKKFYMAIVFLRIALKKYPNNVDILNILIEILMITNKIEEALVNANKLLEFDKSDNSLLLLGNIFEKNKDFKNAINIYSKVQNSNNKNINSYLSISRVFKKIKDFSKSLNVLNIGIQNNPNDIELRINYGNLLFNLGSYSKAKNMYKSILDIDEKSISAYINLGVTHKELGEYDQALEMYQIAIKLDPSNSGAYNNLGVLYKTKEDYLNACRMLKKAMSLNPKNIDAYANFGVILKSTNKPKWALKYYEKTLLLKSSHTNANLDFGIIKMLIGDYSNGLKHYEHRVKLKEFLPRFVGLDMQKDFVKGENIKGKKILVFSEQGFGDTIQFIRFLPILKQKGAYVILRVKKELKRLVEKAQLADMIILEDEKVDYDFHIPLLSIPHRFEINPIEFDNSKEYLKIKKSKNQKIKKIAFAFGGSPTHKGHKFRYINPENFEFLVELENVEIISLQIGKDKKLLEKCAFYEKLIDKSDEINDFYDTAKILSNVDLLITSDTSVSHLGGALGVKTWILLPSNPDWRWGRKEDKTFWYHSVKLFRKEKLYNWNKTFEKIKKELKKEEE